MKDGGSNRGGKPGTKGFPQASPDPLDRFESACQTVGGPCAHCDPVDISIQDPTLVWKRALRRLWDDGGMGVWFCPECGLWWERQEYRERPDWGECMAGQTEPYTIELFYKRTRPAIQRFLDLKGSPCPVCRGIPDTLRVDRLEGETLPDAFGQLLPWAVEGSHVAWQCPRCRQAWLGRVETVNDPLDPLDFVTARRVPLDEAAAWVEQTTRDARKMAQAERHRRSRALSRFRTRFKARCTALGSAGTFTESESRVVEALLLRGEHGGARFEELAGDLAVSFDVLHGNLRDLEARLLVWIGNPTTEEPLSKRPAGIPETMAGRIYLRFT